MTLYVSDLDGTLLGKDQKLSEFTKWALNSLIGRGMRFTYATARSEHSAVRVTEGLTKKLPVIVYNGAFILDGPGGGMLSKSSFTAGQRDAVREQAERRDVLPMVYAFVEGVERLSWVEDRVTPGQAFYLQNRKWDKRLRPVRGTAELFAGEAFYFTFIGEKEELAPLQEWAAGQGWLSMTFQPEIYQPEYWWLELMPKEATKAHAAVKLKEILGCDRMVAFGDAVNDLPLFAAADYSCAVGNAMPPLKEAAAEVIDSNDEDGVAKWLLRNVQLPGPEPAAFSLRRFEEGDLDEVLRLFHSTVHTVCRLEYSREQAEAWAPPVSGMNREAWLESLLGHFSLVAVDGDGMVLGFADLDGHYLDRLYVHPDFQRQGIAQALAGALEEQARSAGETVLTAQVSLSARGFFEGQGFRILQKQQVHRPHPADGRDVALENFLMEKGLVL